MNLLNCNGTVKKTPTGANKRKRDDEETPGISLESFLCGERQQDTNKRVATGRPNRNIPKTPSDILNMFPLKTIKDLEDLEEDLGRSDIGKEIVKLFDAEKSEELYAYTHRIMKKLLAPEVASAYNLTGRNSKRAFKDLRLCAVVVEAAEIHAKKLYTQDIMTEIGTWLSSAKSRKSNKK